MTRVDRNALAIAAFLGAAAFSEMLWLHDLAASNTTNRAVGEMATPVAPSALAYPSRTELAALAQRPLLTVDRRAYVPPPSAEGLTPAGPPPPTIDAELVGIARTGDSHVILVHLRNTPTVHRLRVGEQVEGWTVSGIGASTATLTNSGHERELSLTTTVRP